MPIIDKVLVSEEEVNDPEGLTKWPAIPFIDFLMKTVRKNIEVFGDGPWLTDTSTGRSMSYSELLLNIDSFAECFWKKGLRPGDMVLIIASNFIEFPLVLFGAWRVGGSVATLTLNLLSDHINQRIQQLRPKFIVTDELRLQRVLDAVVGLDYIKEVIVIGQPQKGCSSTENFFSNEEKERPVHVDMDLDSMAWLMFSSGTTGTPKGIVHTHGSVTRLMQNFSMSTSFGNGKKYLFINFMVNTGGLMIGLLLTIKYYHICCMSKFNEENLLVAINDVKPFAVSLFPNQIAWICRHPNLKDYDLKSVIQLLVVGSTMHPLYEQEIFRKLPNLLTLLVRYGMSEIGMICSNDPKPSDAQKTNKSNARSMHVIGSCGKIAPYCKLKIIDRVTGEKLGAGEEGEICVSTFTAMKQYLNAPEETTNFMRDGWCYTGDKGYYDTDENVFVIGRYKELIKYRMAHVVPSSIESELMTHPAVQDAAVVGAPHDVDGERPLAFVVLREGMSATAEEIINYVKERVVDEETLRGGVRFIEKVPRNELGKIVRPRLVEML